jgi:ribosomal peptide maturation radical SAM protein 1
LNAGGFTAAPVPGNAEALIVVPPFAGIERPSLAAHLLQAVAAEAGFQVDVLYANLRLARHLGEAIYQDICYQPTYRLLGERLFAPVAFPQLRARLPGYDLKTSAGASPVRHEDLLARIAAWVEELLDFLAAEAPQIVGCTSSYEQALASLAILHGLKERRPGVITILGGANCEGEMAEGWASCSRVDVIFSGESEATFCEFLHRVRSRSPATARVVRGAPCRDLDRLPTPKYEGYFAQLRDLLPDSAVVRDDHLAISYETSRGCWWGQKHHCTFCGLNGESMAFRAKSPSRVLRDLRELGRTYPTDRVTIVDNIMPSQYFRTLLPALATESPSRRIFYEQKANLSLDKVRLLKAAGIGEIQPGIEALSTSLLRLMKKGTTARQNLALLRFARAVGVKLNWNLLYAFPGDQPEQYEETLQLLPLIRHLPPPGGLHHLSIDRFSPYYDHPRQHGIAALRPLPAYHDVLPEDAPVSQVAYHFVGEYEHAGARHPQLIRALREEVERWIGLWERTELPVLIVARVTEEQFVLLDTRGLDLGREIEIIDIDQAHAALAESLEPTPATGWAVQRGCAARVDGRYVPLAVATPDLLENVTGRLG